MEYQFILEEDVGNASKAHVAILESKHYDTVTVIAPNGNDLNFIRIPGGWIFTMDDNQSFIPCLSMEEP